MTICFGETLRRLRRERNITQEQLSNVLNVSFQAISKWERDESYPDLTMIPVLSDYFGVTADEILGSNKVANEKRILKFLDDFKTNKQYWLKNVDSIKSMLSEFPMDHRIRLVYLECLLHDRSIEIDNFENIYSVIRDYCTDDNIRIRAKRMLCLMYERFGKSKEFHKTANELPVEIADCRTIVDTYLLAKENIGKQTNEDACHNAITELIRLFYETASRLFYHEPQDATDENIEVALTLLKVLHAVYPKGDYGKNYSCIIYDYGFLCAWYAIHNDFDKSFVYLNDVVEHALIYDSLPQRSAHTSLLLRGHIFDKSNADNNLTMVESGMCEHLYNLLTKTYPLPTEFKTDSRFISLAERLKSQA